MLVGIENKYSNFGDMFVCMQRALFLSAPPKISSLEGGSHRSNKNPTEKLHLRDFDQQPMG